MRLVIASRKSDLARLQALRVGAALKSAHSHLDIQYHFRESLGDLNQVNALWQMPEKGVFTEDFLQGLSSGEFDLVVHSWKDLPTEKKVATEVVATLPRADARDVLLVRKDIFTQNLSEWRVLSSSPRRAHFLGNAWGRLAPPGSPPLSFHSVRGNIPTRLLKLKSGEGEALLVAKAALDRLLSTTEKEFAEARTVLRDVLNGCRFMVLPIGVQPPAPGQGALAIEIARNRQDLRVLLQKIHCASTFASVEWERVQLTQYGGGCHLKLGAYARELDGMQIRMVKGLPLNQEPVSKVWIDRTVAPVTRRLANPESGVDEFCALRSIDLFEIHPLNPDFDVHTNARNQNLAYYVAHRNALPANLSSDILLWAAGPKTWEAIAKRGHWVNGADEGWGEEIPSVDELTGHAVQWKKLTHAGSVGSLFPVLATYELKPKVKPAPEVANQIRNAKNFFWHSGSLFERALDLFPEIRSARHCSGLGLTRKTIEKHLGTQTSEHAFLDEAEWRMFYGSRNETNLI